jgi:hypothetical protein
MIFFLPSRLQSSSVLTGEIIGAWIPLSFSNLGKEKVFGFLGGIDGGRIM